MSAPLAVPLEACDPQAFGSFSRGVQREFVLVVQLAQERPRQHTKTNCKRVPSRLQLCWYA